MSERATSSQRPLVMHLVHRFDTGGLENGIVNLLNHFPDTRYRHMVVALTEVNPSFSRRVEAPGVDFVALHKPAGQGLWLYPRFLDLLRQRRPAVLHSRNLGTLEFQLPATLAGVGVRIHGEHGRDIDDLDGSSRRHRWLRRAYRPFVHHHVALSTDLQRYLVEDIGVPSARVTQIYNGVDSRKFMCRVGARPVVEGFPFHESGSWVVGTVGRMQAVKAQTDLAKAFVMALRQAPELRRFVRLVMVGGGPLRAEAQAILEGAGMAGLAWLPGERSDVAEIMRALDCFVLPSLAEGVSNTILEAMATGLPVIATGVGANADLVQQGITGAIVPPGEPAALAQAILEMVADPAAAHAMGAAARDRAVRRFSMPAMASAYAGLYDRLLGRSGPPVSGAGGA